jgi:hypothetical protein
MARESLSGSLYMITIYNYAREVFVENAMLRSNLNPRKAHARGPADSYATRCRKQRRAVEV